MAFIFAVERPLVSFLNDYYRLRLPGGMEGYVICGACCLSAVVFAVCSSFGRQTGSPSQEKQQPYPLISLNTFFVR